MANKSALYWKQKRTYSKADFALIARLDEMDEDMGWMKDVATIKDLQVLNVSYLWELCSVLVKSDLELQDFAIRFVTP